jgi:hypothetical protein
MNLYQKLIAIQKEVRGVQKDSSAGQGFTSYPYVSGTKVLNLIRPRMDKHGVLLVPQVESIENERIDYQTAKGSKSELLTKVTMTFIWIDSESGETLPVKFAANGMNNWDKGLGSALTYAERYFLLKFFHIPTDEDDVDALSFRGNEEEIKPKSRPPYDKAKWKSAVEKHAKGEDMTSALDNKYDMRQEDWNRFYQDVDNYINENNIQDGH